MSFALVQLAAEAVPAEERHRDTEFPAGTCSMDQIQGVGNWGAWTRVEAARSKGHCMVCDRHTASCRRMAADHHNAVAARSPTARAGIVSPEVAEDIH